MSFEIVFDMSEIGHVQSEEMSSSEHTILVPNEGLSGCIQTWKKEGGKHHLVDVDKRAHSRMFWDVHAMSRSVLLQGRSL